MHRDCLPTHCTTGYIRTADCRETGTHDPEGGTRSMSAMSRHRSCTHIRTNVLISLRVVFLAVIAAGVFPTCDHGGTDNETTTTTIPAVSSTTIPDTHTTTTTARPGSGSDVWHPAPGTSWQWQLDGGPVDTSCEVDMYDIDLFDTDQDVIDELHTAGRRVICYFSAGTREDWRPDADDFPPSVLGNPLPGWPGERWLDIRRIDIIGPVLQQRLDLAVAKGCDGVEPDNVDAWANKSGFALTHQDQLDFNRWLADQAHARGLSVGLKNDLDQVADLVHDFDWALNEQCFQYDECERLLPFVENGKAVFGVEYELETSQFCEAANAMNFDWLKKRYELDAFRESCR